MNTVTGKFSVPYVFLKKGFFIVLLLLYSAISYAQNRQDSTLLKMANAITEASHLASREKLYLQTDKPDYIIGDTLWFKSYLFNALSQKASGKSGILYIEIADANNQVIKRMLVSLIAGMGWGDIPLTQNLYPEGDYTLRAYTNWMRNFGEQDIFQKQFSIRNFSKQNWLVNSQFHFLPQANNATIHANLQLNQVNGNSLSFQNVQVALVKGNKVLHRNKFQTDVKGKLDFNFKIPNKTDVKDLSITVTDLRKEASAHYLDIPVILSGEEDIDLQFMPEGGNLIAGGRNLIAFKAINANGMGINVSGNVYNSQKQKVAAFHASHLGMGTFFLTPQTGETYTAEIHLSNGQIKKEPLPEVKENSLLLHVNNPWNKDSIEVSIFASRNLIKAPYYLIGQSRGIGCFAARVVLNQGQERFILDKNIFPSGIAKLIILNDRKQPVCQRMIFINHQDQLYPHFSYKKKYHIYDSVKIKLKITDDNNTPAVGDFSVAVTNDSQVPIDSSKESSIESYMLLTSDLKGHIEDPGYYFQSVMTKKIWQDLDHLLLTQGWVRYHFENDTPPKYQAEKSFSVTGKVLNAFNKPVAKSHVMLISYRPFAIMDTLTPKSGEFNFTHLYPIDTASYFIQARNKRGKSFNVGIELNKFQPPVFSPIQNSIIPWYMNLDTTRLQIVKTQIANSEERNKVLGKHVLKEVIIKGQKVVKNSKNLNGSGDADFTLNQSDMNKEGDATLGDILRTKVKGFRLGGKRLNVYMIHDKKMHLIIDGVNVDFFKPDGTTDREFYKNYFDYLTAKDIKGIEVMTSARYTGSYFQKFLDPMAKPFMNGFIEVTTYSGNGAFLKKTPGVYIYKPAIAFSIPDQFYVPKYPVKTKNKLTDLRSTIYWQPNVITNKKGEALIKFYTAGKPGTYTLILEGADMNGCIGFARKKIIVN